MTAGEPTDRWGNLTAIPLADASVDVVVSGLVLIFVSDQSAALLEMVRATRNGDTIAAYVWDYSGKMELIRFFWDAAGELDLDTFTPARKGRAHRSSSTILSNASATPAAPERRAA